MNRSELIVRIQDKKQEMKTAGKIHRRDLKKYIHRLEVELMKYDYYHKAVN